MTQRAKLSGCVSESTVHDDTIAVPWYAILSKDLVKMRWQRIGHKYDGLATWVRAIKAVHERGYEFLEASINGGHSTETITLIVKKSSFEPSLVHEVVVAVIRETGRRGSTVRCGAIDSSGVPASASEEDGREED